GLLVFNIWRETARQQAAQQAYRAVAVTEGTDLYAAYCAECHGAAGEGLNAYPALDQEFVRQRDVETLYKLIARGHYGTDMTAFGLQEGGILNRTQIESLITVIQKGSWESISQRVIALGFTPAESITTAGDFQAVYTTVSSNPGQTTEQGRVIFAGVCAECHGENGEGTADAPQLNSVYVQTMSADQLLSIINFGVSGTNMDTFRERFTLEEKAALIYLLQHWNGASGVTPTIDTSGVTISGQELFGKWCAPCHGLQGEGGAIAPPLNDVPALPTEFIMTRVRGGKNAMPPFPTTDLPDPELLVLIEYARTEIMGSGLPVFTDAEMETAAELYQQQCAGCHGLQGEGTGEQGEGPPLVKTPPMHASYIHYFTRFGSANTPGIPASVVSDHDLQLIAAYLYSLDKD
ncbi:MAG TPA: c-type cytochrome, partial [Aggregatilineales bacterium]|nr:c-type cytochrome [Aggregatilineales bacterium]